MKPRSRILALLSALLLLAADTVAADSTGYLFATYRGDRAPQEEQIHFALSRDGREWTALNKGEPVLVNQVGEGAARDPFLLRSHDGSKFYLLATDLAIHRNRNFRRAMQAGSRSIVIWESPDLVNWSAPRLAAVAHELAGCTWSPEAVYDPETKAYLVFWASTLSTDGFSKHSIWASYTRDFVTFDPPFIFFEKPGSLTDPTVVAAGHAYYRFAKEQAASPIVMETAPRLVGPWREVAGFSPGADSGLGGPVCYPLSTSADGSPSLWSLLLYHSSRGHLSLVSGNLAEGRFVPLSGVRFPFRVQQGSVLPLMAGEYERLEAAYGR